MEALRYAFDCVLKKHKILSYRIHKYLPTQCYHEKKSVSILEKNIQSLSISDTESFLCHSMDELIQLSSWPKDSALIRAKLFYLQNNVIELQLAIPHIVSDGISLDLLFSELSTYYLSYSAPLNQQERMSDVVPFTDYIIEENRQTKTRLEQDLKFWSAYLSDAHLFAFPKKYVLNSTKNKAGTYSTYVPIPNKAMHHLEAFCMQQQVNFSDALCSAVGLSLRHCCQGAYDENQPILIHLIKSARDKLSYDRTIGCFIRVEAIKLFLNKQQTLLSLSKHVHAFMVKHATFQQCSTSLKFASLNPFYSKRKNPIYYLTRLITLMYTKTSRARNINSTFLQLCPRLSLLDGQNRFMIYLNIWNNFVKPNQNDIELFGLPPKYVAMHQYDLLTIDHLFEVCFMRDENNDRPYVVISSNLEPAFRERIANELIRIMGEDMVHSHPITPNTAKAMIKEAQAG